MKYENPRLSEEQNPNVPNEHPLREAWRVLCWGVGLLLVLWLAVRLLVWSLPSWVSIEDERRWFLPLIATMTDGAEEDPALQVLADTLAETMKLPPGTVRVSVVESSAMEAFATLGGQVALTSRLLQCLPSKDAVAAVLAHEIAHVAHRDPLRASSHDMLTGLLSAAVFGNQGSVGVVQQLASLRYSREMEVAADEAAAHLLAARQGSVGGVIELFETLYRLERPGEQGGRPAGRDAGQDDAAVLQAPEAGPGRGREASATGEGHGAQPQDAGTADERAKKRDEVGQGETGDWLAGWGWFSTHPDLVERMANVRRLAAGNAYAMTTPTEPNPWRPASRAGENRPLDCIGPG